MPPDQPVWQGGQIACAVGVGEWVEVERLLVQEDPLGGRVAGEADLDLLGGVEADGALEETLGAEGDAGG